MECEICFLPFAPAGPQEPRVIAPCGHTFCSHCISTLNGNPKLCPNCRERIQTSSKNVIVVQMLSAFSPRKSIAELEFELAQRKHEEASIQARLQSRREEKVAIDREIAALELQLTNIRGLVHSEAFASPLQECGRKIDTHVDGMMNIFGGVGGDADY